MSDQLTFIARPVLILLAAAALVLSACGRAPETSARPAPMEDRIGNADQVVRSIRHGLRNYASSVTITFSYGSNIYPELNDVIGQWVEAALEETGDPAEGDYIRYQYGGYTYDSSYVLQDGRWHYTVVITPRYYGYLSQEKEAGEEAERLIRSFGFLPWTSGEAKVRRIYDWICGNVTYDLVHKKNAYYHQKSTAYAALVQRTATCQGYCTAAYRLLREAGIPCRIVTGKAAGKDGQEDALHAWLIAEVDGRYYGLDPTWDAGRTEYQYFLLGSRSFADHVPGEKFRTAEFLEQHPMAEEDHSGRSGL